MKSPSMRVTKKNETPKKDAQIDATQPERLTADDLKALRTSIKAGVVANRCCES